MNKLVAKIFIVNVFYNYEKVSKELLRDKIVYENLTDLNLGIATCRASEPAINVKQNHSLKVIVK